MFFSFFFMVAPLLGAYLGVVGVGIALLFYKILSYSLFGTIACTTLGLPTLLASLCWSSKKTSISFLINILVPSFCFLAFLLHPSVQYGWWYGLYWFIPVSLYALQSFGFLRKRVVFTALQSTFVAHAVGSLIWCYVAPCSPDYWLALIPVVAIERMLSALLMTATFLLIRRAGLYFKNMRRAIYIHGRVRVVSGEGGMPSAGVEKTMV